MLDGTQPSRCYRHLLFSHVLTALHPLSFSMLTKYTLSWNVSPTDEAKQGRRPCLAAYYYLSVSVVGGVFTCRLGVYHRADSIYDPPASLGFTSFFLKRASHLRTIMLNRCVAPLENLIAKLTLLHGSTVRMHKESVVSSYHCY